MTTLPACLAKKVHGAFDLVVIGEAEKCIQGKISALEGTAEASAAPVAAQAVVVREARVAVDAAVAEEAQASDKMRTLQAESSEAAAAVEAANAAASLCGAKLAPAQTAAAARQGELDQFLSYNALLFKQLRDRTTDEDSVKKSAGTEEGATLLASLAGA